MNKPPRYIIPPSASLPQQRTGASGTYSAAVAAVAAALRAPRGGVAGDRSFPFQQAAPLAALGEQDFGAPPTTTPEDGKLL